MSAEKPDSSHSPPPSEAPPPYTEIDASGNANEVPRMAATDYYQSHPANAPQQAPAQPPQQQYPPPPPPQNSYSPQQHNNSYPPPPNHYQQGPPQGPPPQGFAPPAPQQNYHQSSHYASPPPQTQQVQPYTQNGWNPSYGPHPHSKPYQSPTPGQQGPNIVHAKPHATTYSTPQPSYPYQQGPPPQGPYPPPQQQAFPPPQQQAIFPPPQQQATFPPAQQQGRPPMQSGALVVPPLPPRRYSEPPEDRKTNRHDGRNERRDDRYDDRDDRDDRRDRRDAHRKGKSKDHTNRNTFLGAGGGALIGDAIFPGLGTVGGLLLGGFAGHKSGRSKSSTGRNDDSGGRRSYEEDWEEGKRRRADRDRERY